jgi:hypothetical protein
MYTYSTKLIGWTQPALFNPLMYRAYVQEKNHISMCAINVSSWSAPASQPCRRIIIFSLTSIINPKHNDLQPSQQVNTLKDNERVWTIRNVVKPTLIQSGITQEDSEIFASKLKSLDALDYDIPAPRPKLYRPTTKNTIIPNLINYDVHIEYYIVIKRTKIPCQLCDAVPYRLRCTQHEFYYFSIKLGHRVGPLYCFLKEIEKEYPLCLNIVQTRSSSNGTWATLTTCLTSSTLSNTSEYGLLLNS